jgi:ribulose-5-phosphate 4-epimerase/fuculose-1-phosphate aldolase
MLIQGHGLTVWGATPFAAFRYAEIMEYLAQQTWLGQGAAR